MHTDSLEDQDYSGRIDFYSLLRDLTIAFLLALVVCAIVYVVCGDAFSALDFAAGSLIQAVMFGGVIAYRARQHFGVGSEEGERDD